MKININNAYCANPNKRLTLNVTFPIHPQKIKKNKNCKNEKLRKQTSNSL